MHIAVPLIRTEPSCLFLARPHMERKRLAGWIAATTDEKKKATLILSFWLSFHITTSRSFSPSSEGREGSLFTRLSNAGWLCGPSGRPRPPRASLPFN